MFLPVAMRPCVFWISAVRLLNLATACSLKSLVLIGMTVYPQTDCIRVSNNSRAVARMRAEA